MSGQDNDQTTGSQFSIGGFYRWNVSLPGSDEQVMPKLLRGLFLNQFDVDLLKPYPDIGICGYIPHLIRVSYESIWWEVLVGNKGFPEHSTGVYRSPPSTRIPSRNRILYVSFVSHTSFTAFAWS